MKDKIYYKIMQNQLGEFLVMKFKERNKFLGSYMIFKSKEKEKCIKFCKDHKLELN